MCLATARLFLDKYLNVCADESEPPPKHQDDRHRAKKLTSGYESVPWKEREDGPRIYAFEREHLYGIMGILIIAGITQKRVVQRLGRAGMRQFRPQGGHQNNLFRG